MYHTVITIHIHPSLEQMHIQPPEMEPVDKFGTYCTYFCKITHGGAPKTVDLWSSITIPKCLAVCDNLFFMAGKRQLFAM